MKKLTLEDYLHRYEHDFPHIFNPKLKKFLFTTEIQSIKRNGNRILFICNTNEQKRVYILLEFCTAEIFRIRFSDNNHFKEDKLPLVVKKTWKPIGYQWEKKRDYICITTAALRIKIKITPWQIRVYDTFGKLILEEQSNGIDGLQNKLVYPLGFAYPKDNRKSISVFESFTLHPEEQLFGLGEKYSDLDKRGKRFTSWNVDTATTVTDRSYINIPFLLSTRGYGIFINTTAKITYELGSESYIASSFEVEDTHLDYYVIYGPTLKQILGRYTELTGRAPVPPKWSFGLWMSKCGYKSREEVEDVAKSLRKKNIPCDVIHLDPWWMREGTWADFEWDTTAFPNPTEMLNKLRHQGFKISLWEQPYVSKNTAMYQEGIKYGYFVRNKKGNIYPFRDCLNPISAIVDFNNPEAVKWYQDKHQKLLKQGVAVFKTDMGEAMPIDAVCYNRLTGSKMHNLYSLLYNQTVYEISAKYSPETALVWGRSGYVGTQRYPVNWSGDSNSTWADMVCNLRAGLNLGLSGIPFWSCDIGGFIGSPNPMLYLRWAQFGLLISHARCHGTTPREPWQFGQDAERIFRIYTQLRYRLIPYIYTYAHLAHRTGLPVIRPLILEYQDDPNVYHQDLEYLLGTEFLVAPIFDETNHRSIYLPAGDWIDYWTKKVFTGKQHIEYTAPLSRLPLFVKQDSIIPMGPAMNYINEKPGNPITLDIYIKTQAQFMLIDNDFEVKCAGKKDKNITEFTISKSRLDFILKYNSCSYPKKVVINGKPIHELRKNKRSNKPLWKYEKDSLIIIINNQKYCVYNIVIYF